MQILDRLRISDDWSFILPLYHRGHLSLYPGTTVYLAPVHRPDRGRTHFPEIVGTTIQQNAWSSVYRISLSFHDAPGVLHSALESIARHGGNVLNLDSASSDQETLHNIELLVDFASLLDGDTLQASVDLASEIEGIILADCSAHVLEEPRGQFSVRVRPLLSLRRLDQMVSKIRGTARDVVQEAVISRDGRLDISKAFRILLGTLAGVFGENDAIDNLSPPIQYFVTSDTRDRVFRITLIKKPDSVVWCAIKHQDRPGALSTATDALQKQGITVLTALNRIQRHQGTNWFEIIVSKQEWITAPSGVDGRKAELIEIFSKTQLGTFDYQLYFDRRDADSAMRVSVEEEHRVRAWVNKRQSIDEWIKEKDELESRLRNELVRRRL